MLRWVRLGRCPLQASSSGQERSGCVLSQSTTSSTVQSLRATGSSGLCTRRVIEGLSGC
ncbi:unnamed protein product [Cylicostephanus goldi]|uniref:Uncharacterized protein n=1 Tax=Cylicostephanus goldi TaxID=71465 RepID=A0A3P6R6T4_CYLGO|nr:unnamed protein product [Cylicostephanus goldi]